MAGEEDKNGQASTAEEVNTPVSTVSDEDLARAYEAAASGEEAPQDTPDEPQGEEEQPKAEAAPIEGEGEEVAKEEPPPAEDDATPKADPEHPTKLGRKVAKLEDMVQSLLTQNAELIKRLTPGQPVEQEAPVDDGDPEEVVLTTAADFERYQERKAAKQNEAVVKYQTSYLSSLKGWQEQASDDPDVAAIYKLLTDDGSPFNVKRSSDPATDFEVNLGKAEAHYYKQKATAAPSAPNSPLKNDKAKAPMGVAGESRSEAAKATPKIKLTPEAMEFIKAQGMSEEEAMAVLATPAPMHLRRGR